MKKILLLLAGLAATQGNASKIRICYVGDLQACKTCSALGKALVKAQPNAGEYYRGAQWNGLYAAYVHDCAAIAEDLLKRGGNPNWGGSSGSMSISVSSRWPHHDKTVNQKWAALIRKHGASINQLVPGENKTPDDIQKEYQSTPDYPSIWSLFRD